jgi:thiamine biosynthesis protein ThiS
MELVVNGASRRFDEPLTAAGLLAVLELDPRAVVVELNRRIVRRPELEHTALATATRWSWCTLSEAGDMSDTLDTPLVIGGHAFRSRLFVGTGKYADNARMIAAIEASGAECVTVAVRRVDLDRSKGSRGPPSPRSGPILSSRQYRGVLLGGRGGALRPAGPRRRVQRLREARSHRRQGNPPPDVAELLVAARELVADGSRCSPTPTTT